MFYVESNPQLLTKDFVGWLQRVFAYHSGDVPIHMGLRFKGRFKELQLGAGVHRCDDLAVVLALHPSVIRAGYI